MRRQRIVQKRRRRRDLREVSHLKVDQTEIYTDPAYRAWLRDQRCVVCLHVSPQAAARSSTYAAHTVNGGMGLKGSDRLACSLCLEHHDEFDGRRRLPNGQVGKRAFEAFYAINLAGKAREQFEQFQQETMKPQ